MLLNSYEQYLKIFFLSFAGVSMSKKELKREQVALNITPEKSKPSPKPVKVAQDLGHVSISGSRNPTKYVEKKKDKYEVDFFATRKDDETGEELPDIEPLISYPLKLNKLKEGPYEEITLILRFGENWLKENLNKKPKDVNKILKDKLVEVLNEAGIIKNAEKYADITINSLNKGMKGGLMGKLNSVLAAESKKRKEVNF